MEYLPDFAFFGYEPTDDERSEVSAWIIVNDCRGVEGISISKTAVTMDGMKAPMDVKTGAAVRRGDLTDELTEAYMMLHEALRREPETNEATPAVGELPISEVNIYWYPEPSPSERAMAEAWVQTNDCAGVTALAISPTVVAAFSAALDAWSTTEMRENHAGLRSALTAVVARLRRGG